MTANARVRVAAALGGLAALGTVAGGFLGARSAETRVLFVLFGGWVVPAILFVPLVRRFVDGIGAYAVAFFFALSIHAIVSEAFRLAGASFTTYSNALTWLLLVAFGATMFLSWLRQHGVLRIGPPERLGARTLWVLAALGGLVAIAAWSRGAFTVAEDAFDHIGFVRRVIDYNSMRPDGVLAWPVDATQSLAPDPRKGALHPTVAWVANLAAADPAAVWSLLPLVLYPAFVLAFIAFTRALLSTRGLVVGCVGLFLLSYGGTAFQLAHAAAYGQNLAAAWYWVLAAVTLFRESGSTGARVTPPRRHPLLRREFTLAVLAFGGTLAHVGTAFHVVLLAVTLFAFARVLGFDYGRALTHAAVLCGAAGVAAWVRLGSAGTEGNALHTHVQGVMFVGERLFVVSPMEILRQYGMCFLGSLALLPFLMWIARRRSDARAVLALCAIPVCIAFVPPLTTALFAKGSYMVSRGLLNAPVYAASAIVLACMIDVARRRGTIVKVSVAVVLAAWSLVFVRPALDATRADLSKRARTSDEAGRSLAGRVANLPHDAVCLSDPATAYQLSAFTSNRFVALYEQHANPRDAYALGRLEAVRNVLSPFANAQGAVDACRRYGVDFVIVSAQALSAEPGFMTEWDPTLFPATRARLRGIGHPFYEVASTEGYSIFELLDTSSTPAAAPDPLRAPVVVEAPALAPCTIVAPERAFEVTGISVTPAVVTPGDSVVITIGYRRDEATPFGLPFLIHVRFDHESVVAAHAYPGEKYVRRFEDRRDGVVTRFRADIRPGGGIFEPDLWPMGAPLCQRVGFVVPRAALPGRYLVEVRVVRDSLLPNFHARDLLYNRDHYSGTACTWVDVGAGEQP